jgi:hypothetical protein
MRCPGFEPRREHTLLSRPRPLALALAGSRYRYLVEKSIGCTPPSNSEMDVLLLLCCMVMAVASRTCGAAARALGPRGSSWAALTKAPAHLFSIAMCHTFSASVPSFDSVCYCCLCSLCCASHTSGSARKKVFVFSMFRFSGLKVNYVVQCVHRGCSQACFLHCHNAHMLQPPHPAGGNVI